MAQAKKTRNICLRDLAVALALASAALVILSSISSALVHPLDEEALEAYFREKTAENYGRMVQEKIDELENINELILENPDLYETGTRGIIGYFILMLQPFYVASIIVTGIYLIFFSGSPESRTKAKRYLFLAIIAIALITVSVQIMTLFFSLSKSLTMLVLSLAPIDSEKSFVHAAEYIYSEGSYIISHKGPSSQPSGDERAGIPLLFLSYALLEAMLLLLRIRIYIAAILAMILPLTITAYAFLPLRRVGRFLFEQTILWTLAQAAMALVLIVVALGVNATSLITSFAVPEMLKVIIEIAGLIMLAVTPIVFVKWFSGFMKEER